MKTFDLSDGITLTEVRINDAPDIFRTLDANREYFGRWLPFVEYTYTVDDSVAFLEMFLKTPGGTKEYLFAIRDNGQFVGLIGFKSTDPENFRTEIGYWLREESQGKGIMTRAVDRLCRFAFDNMNMNRVQIRCAVGNTRSGNIPRRLGFRLEGVERAGELLTGGKFVDVEVYSMLKEDM